MSNSTNLTTQKQQPRFSVAIQTKTYQSMIANTLRDPDRQKRFVASITSAVAVNPALQECEASTILAGALLGESLNLSPSPQLGQYYLVPFKQKEKRNRQGELISPETTKATFVLGYKGYIQLALRSGSYKDLDVMEIKQGEFKGKDPRTGRPMFEFMSDEEAWEKAPTIGYMAFFEYLNGFTKMLYWSKDKMMRHADQYSPAFSASAYKKLQDGEIPNGELWKYSSFWYKDFDGMAKKTMLRQLISKWGIMSTEMVKAMDTDNSIAEISGDDIVTTPDEAIPIDQPEAVDVVANVSLDDI
jgi:recombinase, phage recT family